MKFASRRIEYVRNHPYFHGALFAMVGVAAVLLFQIYREVHVTRGAARKVVRLQRELHAMESVSPQPTTASARKIENDLRDTEHRQNILRGQLLRRPMTVTPASPGSASATRASDYFEIAAFRAQMRAEAERCGIEVRADEFFSFAEYANVGPAQTVREQVLKDRIVAEHLLRALYVGKPAQVLGVERRHPAATERSTDTPVASTTFELTFSGETATLRALLNQVAASEFPLFVRSVEVQPNEGTQPAITPLPQRRSTSDAVVKHALSRFSVTIDFVEFTDASTPAA